MISKNVCKFCCENISSIENYEIAVQSEEQYDCHHRLEIKEDGSVVSMKELIAQGLYYNRPASELIFLLRIDHKHLHAKHPVKISDDCRRKMSESQKRRFASMSEEERKAVYGHSNTEESIQKNRESQLKRFASMSPEERKATFGRPWTEERRKQVSEKLKGKKFSKERNEQIRQKLLGKHHSEETKKKISDIAKEGYASGKRTPWNKGKDCGQRSEEAKKKTSETLKIKYALGIMKPSAPTRGKHWKLVDGKRKYY